MRFFVGIYYCMLCVVHLCALPLIAILSLKQKYKESLKKRFFSPIPLPSHTLKFRWIHACSFGEVKSLQSIINTLQTQLKDDETILLTTTTQTGFNLANTLYPTCTIAYLPFETLIPFWLHNKQILSLTLIEAELWFMPLVYAKKMHAKTTLLNARISTRSFPRYLRFRFFYSKLFDYIDTIFCQSQEDKTRLEALGAKNIQVFGNLKLAEIPRITNTYLPPQKPLWVIASTHSKNGISEEVLILQEILKAYPTDYNTQIFLFAPRHPERFLEVESLLNAILTQNNLPTITKTSTNGIPHSLQSSFVLLDALGELNNLYNIAYGVILGGSFLPDIGGHNPIEPAFFHTKLISGPYIFNQNALFACVENYVLSDLKNLAQTLQTPLKNSLITQHLDITQLIKESQ